MCRFLGPRVSSANNLAPLGANSTTTLHRQTPQLHRRTAQAHCTGTLHRHTAQPHCTGTLHSHPRARSVDRPQRSRRRFGGRHSCGRGPTSRQPSACLFWAEVGPLRVLNMYNISLSLYIYIYMYNIHAYIYIHIYMYIYIYTCMYRHTLTL